MAEVVPLRGGEPTRVGQYEIIGRLGRGGQGTVYLGHRADDPRRTPVAVKLLHPQFTDDSKARSRLLREASFASKVARFCTAQVLDFGEDDDRVYLVSEYVEGSSLTDLLERDGPRTGVALERLAISTVTALAAIHEAGVVHLDFKPANVLIGPDGPIVIDFGIAKALDTAASASTGQIIGSPVYMAPEQYNGTDVGPATDMFAWGVTMVHAATGTPAFGLASAPAMMQRILLGEPDLSGLESPLRELVGACVAKDPALRPSARDVLLRLIGQGQVTTPDAQSTVPQPAAVAAPALFALSTWPDPRPAQDPQQAPAAPGAVPGGVQPQPGWAAARPAPSRNVPTKALAIGGAAVAVAAIAIVAAVGVPMLTRTDHKAAGVTTVPATAGNGSEVAGSAEAPGSVPSGSAAQGGQPSVSAKAGSQGVQPTPDRTAPSTPSKKYVPPPYPGGGAPPARPIPWTLNQICGSGMAVVDSHGLGRATVYLMYDNSSGANCVTTTVPSSSGPSTMGAYLARQGGPATSDTGNYSYYAGPVKVSARGTCVKWGGTYGSGSWTSGWSHCG